MLYSISFIEILLLPLVIDENIYAEFEYLKNAVFLFPMILLGGHSGYTYLYYRTKKDDYFSLINVGLLLSIIASVLFAIYIKNIYVFLPCIAINIFSIVEQRLKIKKSFVTAFLFKPLLSLFTLIITLIFFWGLDYKLKADSILNATFLTSILIWVIMVLYTDAESLKLSFTSLKNDFYKYTIFVKKIFTGVLASTFLTGFFFLERYYVNKFYTEELADYSFSFNLVQLMIILITTLSYISSNLLGERLYTIQKSTLVKYFKILIIGFLILLVGLIIFSFLMKTFFFQKFDNMVIYTSIIGLSKGFVFLVGILTPLAVYNDFNNRMLVCIASLFVLSNLTAYGLHLCQYSIIHYLIFNGMILLIYPIFNLDIIFRKISYKN